MNRVGLKDRQVATASTARWPVRQRPERLQYHGFQHHPVGRRSAEPAVSAEDRRPDEHDPEPPCHRQEGQLRARQPDQLLHLAVAAEPRRRPEQPARLRCRTASRRSKRPTTASPRSPRRSSRCSRRCARRARTSRSRPPRIPSRPPLRPSPTTSRSLAAPLAPRPVNVNLGSTSLTTSGNPTDGVTGDQFTDHAQWRDALVDITLTNGETVDALVTKINNAIQAADTADTAELDRPRCHQRERSDQADQRQGRHDRGRCRYHQRCGGRGRGRLRRSGRHCQDDGPTGRRDQRQHQPDGQDPRLQRQRQAAHREPLDRRT